jgi:hypothetical protein
MALRREFGAGVSQASDGLAWLGRNCLPSPLKSSFKACSGAIPALPVAGSVSVHGLAGACALSTDDAVEPVDIAWHGAYLENSCNKLKQEGNPWPCTPC